LTPSPLIPGTTEPTLRLSVPDDGIRDGDLVLRLPREADIDVLLPVFADPELREAGNLPDMSRDEALATLPLLPALAESGRMAPVVATDAESGALLGGATLHHLDAERAIVEIGYWLLPGARGRIVP
jgi:RimJ/RimL family protein N-acetyltransferase